jgi:hypothetical protein
MAFQMNKLAITFLAVFLMLHGTSAVKSARGRLGRVASTKTTTGGRRALKKGKKGDSYSDDEPKKGKKGDSYSDDEPKKGKKGGSSSDDEPICLTDFPANAVAAAISTELASFWDSMAFDCTPEGVANAFDQFFLPDAYATIQGVDVGLNNIEEIKNAFVGDETAKGSIVYACSSGQVFSWYVVGVEVLDCNRVVAKANEMISDGSAPFFDPTGESLPGGREYSFELDQDTRFLNIFAVNIVCPFADGVNACPA